MIFIVLNHHPKHVPGKIYHLEKLACLKITILLSWPGGLNVNVGSCLVFFFLDLLCVEFHPLLFLPHNHYCEYSILISGDGMLLMGAGAAFK